MWRWPGKFLDLCTTSRTRVTPDLTPLFELHYCHVLLSRSIAALGKIAARLPLSADTIISRMISFFDMKVDYVTAETAIAFKDILRCYPDRASRIVPHVSTVLKRYSLEGESESLVAVIWMLGEYGNDVPAAPYIIERLIDNVEEVRM